MMQSHVNDLLESELISCARNAPYFLLAEWMDYLGISGRDLVVLGKVYSFQIAHDNGECDQYCHMSLSEMGKALNIDRSNLHKVLKGLVDSGLVVKESNGARKPATYHLDERRCMLVAISNGYKHPGLIITKAQAEELLRREGHV